jgi:hypothetical protein
MSQEQSLIGNSVDTFTWEKVTHNLPLSALGEFSFKMNSLVLSFVLEV